MAEHATIEQEDRTMNAAAYATMSIRELEQLVEFAKRAANQRGVTRVSKDTRIVLDINVVAGYDCGDGRELAEIVPFGGYQYTYAEVYQQAPFWMKSKPKRECIIKAKYLRVATQD